MDTKRAYRFRCYPTPEQQQALARTFGCARFVYNHMLRLRTDAWFQRQERVGYHATSSALTALKKQPELAWLNEVSSVPLQQSLRHLQTAFGNFFAKRAAYPSFKSRHDRQAAEYTTSAFKWDGKALRLAKMDEALRVCFSRTIPKAAKVTTVTVSRDAAGRYFVSMLCDDAVQALPTSEAKVGIDLGLTHFAILSSGEKIAAPNTFRKNESKLAKWQRRLARKVKGSRNHAKARVKVARVHAHMADARRDFLHKLSTRLIRENHRWHPSSKRCSECGHTVQKMPLKVREWTCPECGSVHDRDINAARNVLAAGLAVSAHGEAVSPVCI